MNRRSIEYVLQQMGITETRRTGEWIMTTCPLAKWTHASGTDRHPSFGIRESVGISGVHCFSCGLQGGMLKLVKEFGGYAVRDGLWTEETVQQMTDFVLLAEMEDTVESHVNKVTEVVIAEPLRQCLNKPHEYFASRGITEGMVEKWGLGYIDRFFDERTMSEMRSRVLFPVYEKQGTRLELKGIVGRTVDGEEPKYKNAPPSFQKTRHLYGGWLIEEQRKLIVVEGPVDCIVLNERLSEAGLADEFFAVALMGADPNKLQLSLLKEYADEVICMLDNDPSGMLGNKKLIDGLESHVVVSVVLWKDEHKDPDQAGEYAIEMIRNRVTVLEHRLSKVLSRYLQKVD